MSSHENALRPQDAGAVPGVRNRKDFAAGLVFAGLGIALALVSSRYQMGTTQQMGPGFVPFWLAVLLAAAGAVVMLGALGRSAKQTGMPAWDLSRPLGILGPTLLCGFLLPRAGLVISITILVLLSSRASKEFRWRGALACAAAIVAICLIAFSWMLDLQLPVWPALLQE